MNMSKETAAVSKLWTFGDADKYEITATVPAEADVPPVTLALPPTIESDPENAEIDLTWAQAMQLRDSLNALHSWIAAEV